MKVNKFSFNFAFQIVIALMLFGFGSNIYSQNLTSASWTSWMRIQQNICIQRAKASLNLAKIRLTERNRWYVVGKAKNLNVRIKCVADNNNSNLLTTGSNRMLVDVEVEGFTKNFQSLNRLRNCIRQFMQTGKSSCWNTGGTASSMKVSARKGWQRTGVRVNAGQRIRLSAIGNVQYTPRKNAPNGGRCGPVGVKGFRSYSVNPAWNHCALIGRIGRQMFLVNGGGTFTATQSGILELRVNDKDIGNNGGEFTVSITKLR